MTKAGFMSLDFSFYIEPEEGVNTPAEFSAALLDWARKVRRRLTILEEGMEPRILLDGESYVCRLAEPSLATQKNRLFRSFFPQGFTHRPGKFLGYQWIYVYRI